MLASRDEIARVIPHAGNMCLLDAVEFCDTEKIRCVSRTHRDPHNPMRAGGELAALCGVEYAAQTMAVHGGLTGDLQARPRRGYLASLREMQCRRSRLDDLAGDLIVDAERLMGDGNRVTYRFSLRVGDVEVLSGRATVILDAGGADS
jgi:predicted hotdog family 3-hydroxylacyl-ACP dehydratase